MACNCNKDTVRELTAVGTGCACNPTTFPHWCERHQCLKEKHLCGLCKTKEHYFQGYELKRLPCQKPAEHRGFGDTVAAVISWLGWKKKCLPCVKRQSFLNRVFPYQRKAKPSRPPDNVLERLLEELQSHAN